MNQHSCTAVVAASSIRIPAGIVPQPKRFLVVSGGVFVNHSVKLYSTMWNRMKRATLLRVSISCDDATTPVEGVNGGWATVSNWIKQRVTCMPLDWKKSGSGTAPVRRHIWPTATLKEPSLSYPTIQLINQSTLQLIPSESAVINNSLDFSGF
jgi:hypothetical protein